jgi:hypothetical protein
MHRVLTAELRDEVFSTAAAIDRGDEVNLKWMGPAVGHPLPDRARGR